MDKPADVPADVPVTQLLAAMRAGDAAARDALFRYLYGAMRDIAGRLMRNERPGHTLGPTGLLHEAYLKLFAADAPPAIPDRRALFGLMVQAMHRVLVDYARYRNAQVRGGGAVQSLDVDVSAGSPLDEWMDEIQREYDFEKATRALEVLAGREPEQYVTFVLVHYCGWTHQAIAESLDCSLATVGRHWLGARTFVQHQLRPADEVR